VAKEFDGWKVWMVKEKGMLPNTVRLYSRTIEVFEREVGEPAVQDTDTIRDWLLRKGGASGTFSNRLSGLRSYYRYLVKRKIRPDDPTFDIEAPRRRKGLPKPIRNLEEALARLDAADVTANEKGAIPRRVGQTRDMAVFLCETGLRIHEAVQLNEPTPCGDTLTLIGKGAKEAIIPLTPKAREALDRLGGKWPIGARATQRRFERADFSPHQCRHTRGTSMAEAGCDLGDIQAMLRHSSPATTLVYSAWSTSRVRDALAKVPA
jgi:site-specific recombinase XerD